MTTKGRPSRTIVYKYVEVPQAPPTAPAAEPTSQSPKESLAYHAWTNCYQPPTVHFDLPSPTSSSSSSTSSSRSDSTSNLHSSVSSTSSHGLITKSSSPLTTPSAPPTEPSPPAPKPPPPAPKTRAYSSPAILTKPSNISTKPKPSGHPIETSYTTTTTTITTKDGTFIKEHKIVSSHGFHDRKGAVDWSVFRSPDWEYPLQKKVKGKKVLASYPRCQAW